MENLLLEYCSGSRMARRCATSSSNECALACHAGACISETLNLPGYVTCDPSTGLICDVSGGGGCCVTQDNNPVNACRTDPNAPDACVHTLPGGSTGSTTYHECDDHSDCQSGQICCWDDYYDGGTHCQPQGSDCFWDGGPQQRRLCDPDAATPCPDGRVCESRFMTGGEIQIYTCENP